MKEVINKPVNDIKIKLRNLEDIEKINNLGLETGNTTIKIDLELDTRTLSFKLGKKRKIDYKMLNLLRNNQHIEIL